MSRLPTGSMPSAAHQKPAVCAVAHPDIVDMEDHGTFDTEGAGQGHDRG
jgi:hypothetical protein